MPLASFVLHDVEGSHGGVAVWAPADGTATVQVVPPGPPLRENRYRITLTADQWAEVERLVGFHHLPAARMNTRPATPGESHPIILSNTRSGTTTRLRKLSSDRHAAFDPVYAHLLGLCRVAGEPVWEGEFDWHWRPDGFAALWGS